MSNLRENLSTDDKRSLIGIRLQMLVDLFGKRVADDSMDALRRVYCDTLEGFPSYAISKGFSKAEQSCEKFPTPKTMREFIAGEVIADTSRYTFRTAKATDPITGEPIEVMLDPETGQRLYRPQDCPEGRWFLAKLKEIARR